MSRSSILLKSILCSLATLGLYSQLAFAQEYTPIKRLGTNQAICKPGIESRQELKDFFANQRDDVLNILNDSGWQGNPADIFSAVASDQFDEQSFAVGTRLHWMGMRVKGTPSALPKRVWAGKDAFDAFTIDVNSNCANHKLVVPKICCNIALLATTPIVVSAPALEVVQQGDGGRDVTFKTAPGALLTLTRPNGNNYELTDNGEWSGSLSPGAYTISSQLKDDCGDSPVVSKGFIVDEPALAAAPAALAPKANTIIPFIAPFIGHEDRNRPGHGVAAGGGPVNCPAWLVGVKGGVIKPVSNKVSVFGSIGGAANLNESSNSSLFADVGVERRVGEKGFIGAGVGVWDINNSDTRDESIFIHGGLDTNLKLGKSSGQWFVEGRFFADESDDIGDNNVITTGLRFIFE